MVHMFGQFGRAVLDDPDEPVEPGVPVDPDLEGLLEDGVVVVLLVAA